MIHAAVTHIASQLNQFLKRSFDLTEDMVVVSNILEQDGTVAPSVSNKLVVFVVNVEKETAHARGSGMNFAESWTASYPPLFLNLYVMVAANFSGSNYSEGLKYLSNAVSFFQRQPVFDHHQTPDLDRRIGKLVLDIENLNMQDLSGLWGALSGHYQPSVLYKARMVCFTTGDVLSEVAPIKGLDTSTE